MFKHYKKNILGRDFVCGDLHGCYSDLEQKLKELNFNKYIDRLFSVGDLTDRGNESHRVMEFIDEPWFFPVMGNHEDMIIRCYGDKVSIPSWHYQNGGGWIVEQSEEWVQTYIEKIRKLPLAIQVGDVGIIHARTPEGINWQTVISNLDDEDIRKTLLWDKYDCPKLDDIEVVYAGHKINDTITYYGSIKDIDTGAFCKHWGRDYGHLTVCEI